jgi:hypothetical protein
MITDGARRYGLFWSDKRERVLSEIVDDTGFLKQGK